MLSLSLFPQGTMFFQLRSQHDLAHRKPLVVFFKAVTIVTLPLRGVAFAILLHPVV